MRNKQSDGYSSHSEPPVNIEPEHLYPFINKLGNRLAKTPDRSPEFLQLSSIAITPKVMTP
jgi:hypothetical protein